MEQLALTHKLTDWLNVITGRRMAGSSATLDEMLRVEREMSRSSAADNSSSSDDDDDGRKTRTR